MTSTSTTVTAKVAAPAYVAGGTLSMLGNSAILIALPWLVLSRTGDLATASLIATISGIAAVPAALANSLDDLPQILT